MNTVDVPIAAAATGVPDARTAPSPLPTAAIGAVVGPPNASPHPAAAAGAGGPAVSALDADDYWECISCRQGLSSTTNQLDAIGCPDAGTKQHTRRRQQHQQHNTAALVPTQPDEAFRIDVSMSHKNRPTENERCWWGRSVGVVDALAVGTYELSVGEQEQLLQRGLDVEVERGVRKEGVGVGGSWYCKHVLQVVLPWGVGGGAAAAAGGWGGGKRPAAGEPAGQEVPGHARCYTERSSGMEGSYRDWRVGEQGVVREGLQLN